MHNRLRELPCMLKLAGVKSHLLPTMRDYFHMALPHDPRGIHLALVMGVNSGNLEALRRSSPTGRLPGPLVQHIVSELLLAMTTLHSLNIIHAGMCANLLMRRL